MSMRHVAHWAQASTRPNDDSTQIVASRPVRGRPRCRWWHLPMPGCGSGRSSMGCWAMGKPFKGVVRRRWPSHET